VRIGLSGLSFEMHRALGRIIAQAADALGRTVAFIASGDLSHKLLAEGPYGFAPEGPVFDERIGEIFASGDLDELFAFDEEFCDAAAECGLRSFQIMAGALDGASFESRMLSNEGPFGVGYGVAILTPADTGDGHEEQIDPCIALARLSVETFVKTGKPAKLPPDVPVELLNRRAGAFVSLHEHGELRGCIGTISATTASIAQEILQNGIGACSRDPRFDAVRPDELDFLEYSVDILGDAEPIDSPEQLDVKRYGVIVTQGWKRGLLLPNLDGVDTVDYQLEIAKRKAGIHPAADDVQLERFEVVRHTRGGEPRRRS
jgi:AmmeMemoRadiSam system protein A